MGGKRGRRAVVSKTHNSDSKSAFPGTGQHRRASSIAAQLQQNRYLQRLSAPFPLPHPLPCSHRLPSSAAPAPAAPPAGRPCHGGWPPQTARPHAQLPCPARTAAGQLRGGWLGWWRQQCTLQPAEAFINAPIGMQQRARATISQKEPARAWLVTAASPSARMLPPAPFTRRKRSTTSPAAANGEEPGQEQGLPLSNKHHSASCPSPLPNQANAAWHP